MTDIPLMFNFSEIVSSQIIVENFHWGSQNDFDLFWKCILRLYSSVEMLMPS